LNNIRKKENGNIIVWFYPERAPQKAISKSTVKTVIALANKKQGQLYKASRCREQKRLFMPLQELVVQLKARKNLQLTLKNAFVFGSWKGDNGF